MGLDMYLTAERYVCPYSEKEQNDFNVVKEVFPLVKDFPLTDVVFQVGYWRKANAIHKFFVDVVQDGVDECQKTWVATEYLEDLKLLCQQVIDYPDKASLILPTKKGFFFGDIDYDDYYFQYLQDTIDIITKLEPLMEPGFDFYYQASW